jgi:hypothetical protein
VLEPEVVLAIGPAREIAGLDSVRLQPVPLAGRRDTVQVTVGPSRLPPGSSIDPAQVEVTLAIEPEATRRTVVEVESPREGADVTVSPAKVTVIVAGPRSRVAALDLAAQKVHWTVPGPISAFFGHRVALRRVGGLPAGVHARLDPDSVLLRAPGR